MPRSPKGEKRPADAIGRTIMTARIAPGATQQRRSDVAYVE
jgi:hypothetical protein